ncbi:integral membrane sensor signal transduction histidine kinase [Clostridium sp. CAG:356]|nr:integral membrane sensor signal transduction histidine kinase [Clostridium sp. CAG:356]
MKKLIIQIFTITTLIVVLNYIVITNQNKKQQEKVNDVIVNIVGTIKQEYPDLEDEKIIKILNDEENNAIKGIGTLQRYGINTEEVYAIDGLKDEKKEILLTSSISIISLTIIVTILIINYKNKKSKKIENIINYIEEINKKNYNLKIEENTEDELSNLTNELYKITIMLKEQAELSKKDKNVLQRSLEDISHQIKTPLTSISIMLDNIKENPQMDLHTRQEFIYEISRQIEWINWLVISLLKLSKLDSNTIDFKHEEINAENLINNVIKNLAIPLDIKQQSVIVTGNNETFIGDYNWELEALTNIVKNCIEHTPENKKIYINCEKNNFNTKIVIRDEGNGIDREDIKHIFERFYKGKNSSENSVGIGLALSKSIIEKDNGYILCTSEVGKGTTFEIKYIRNH